MYSIEKIAWIDCVFAPIEWVKSTTIEVLVKAWSIYETKETNGLSHFLEHMFFKWWKKYPTPKAVAQALDTLGASYNAFTWNEYAGYYVKVAEQFVETALEVLADMLVDSQFPIDEIESEKWVIVQEIKMYEDMPAQLVSDKRSSWYYGDNPYGWSILWPEENVKGFTQADFLKHKQALYAKDNLVVAVGWSLANKDTIVKRIEELFGGLPEHATWSIPSQTFTPPKQQNDKYSKWTQQNHVIIGWDGVLMHDEKRYAFALFSIILWWTMSSRLFQNIREKQWLCYYIWSGQSFWDSFSSFYIRAWMEKDRREPGLEAIYNEIDSIVSWWITDEEYEQARKHIQWWLSMSLETSDSLANYVARQVLFTGEVESIDTKIEKYLAVSKDEINAIWEYFDRDNLYAYRIE